MGELPSRRRVSTLAVVALVAVVAVVAVAPAGASPGHGTAGPADEAADPAAQSNASDAANASDVPSAAPPEDGRLKPAPAPRPAADGDGVTEPQPVLSDTEESIVVHDFRDGSDRRYTTGGQVSADGNESAATAGTRSSGTDGATPIQSTAPDGDRTRVPDTTAWPHSPVVQVRIDSDGDGVGEYGCSGTLVDENHVMTAAHCAYQSDYGGWADALSVVPAADGVEPDDQQPFYSADVVYGQTYDRWVDSEPANWDIAVLTLDRPVGEWTGTMGYYTTPADSPVYDEYAETSGYPVVPPSGPYPSMWTDYDEGAGTGSCAFCFDNDPRHYYWLVTTGGQSGSPVYKYLDTSYPGVESPGYYALSVVAYQTAESFANFGTRLTNNKYSDMQSMLAESGAAYTPADRPELAEHGTNSLDQSTAEQGASVNASVDVTNEGTESTGCYDVTLYASADDAIDRGDRELGTETLCSHTPFTVRTASVDGSVPESMPAGTYTVGAIIDDGESVDEYGTEPGELSNTARLGSLTVEEGTTVAEAVASAGDGDDSTVEDGEIQQAVFWWQTGTEVPGTGGETISDAQIQDLVFRWQTGATVDG
ncbi:trypsin-like serine peptidase [Haloarcula marina]|uniref:trypsin-like serine peptidase n=1 Tax=Haloarcula marina TaxID=2961574 RepID=UPI0020B7562F|nr:trypsin-like serine protease [Halomicroarcula marina]